MRNLRETIQGAFKICEARRGPLLFPELFR